LLYKIFCAKEINGGTGKFKNKKAEIKPENSRGEKA